MNINYYTSFVVMSNSDNINILYRTYDNGFEAKKGLYFYLLQVLKPNFEKQLELIREHIEDEEKKQ